MKTVEGTTKAFLLAIRKRGVNKLLGNSKSTVSTWRKNPPSIEKQEKVLLQLGSKIVKDKIWKIKFFYDNDDGEE